MTATRGESDQVHFHSPPADIAGRRNEAEVTIDPNIMAATNSPPMLSMERLSLQPLALNALWQWGVIVALAAWVLMVSSGSQAGMGAAALLVVAGLLNLLISQRVNHGAVTQRGGMAVAILGFLVAMSATGLVGATLVSPVVLLLPALVWTLAATAPKPWMVNLGIRGGVVTAAGIAALSASRFADTPTPVSGTAVMGVTLVVVTFAAGWHGRHVGSRLLKSTVGDTWPADSMSTVNPIDAARLEIASQSDPAGIAQTAANAIDRQLRPSYIAIVEQVPEEHVFVALAEIINDPSLSGLGRRLTGITDSAITKGSALWMLGDVDDTFTATCRRMGIQAALIVPLEHLSHRIGAIQIAWTGALGPAALAGALSFSSELARLVTPDLAIAQFSSEIERGYFDAIASLAARVDDRDAFTRGHSRRVARHALTIAEVLNLNDDQQRKLLYAAELHDIGRIGVSENILSKPGTLTAGEWDQVRTYPRISADIVEPLSFFTDVREVVLHQNERWDGAGYPDKLSGTEIPLLARILAVADAFDAMTSTRAYRSALSPQMALTELWKARGTKYDPEIVEAFVMHGSVRSKVA
ncbi:MAG: HD-GYP domain-containing protein [Chloroflexia bacterium]|nr:HD-GYP domain-containing protein [Chloroflexia bacterium]